MKRRTASIALLGCGALAAGIALLPHEEERAVIAYRDGNIANAIGILDRLAAIETANAALTMQLHKLHDQAGNAEESIASLEDYLVLHGRDEQALEKLIDLYRATMQTPQRREALERLLAIAVHPVRVRELIGVYRLTNDEDAEFKLLADPRIAFVLSYQDMERLAVLALARGDVRLALMSFSAADEHAPPSAYTYRLSYLDLLIGRKRFDEAKERLLRWVAGWRDEKFQSQIGVLRFAQAAPQREVAKLVRRLRDVAPGMDIWLTRSLAEYGRGEIARRICAEMAAGLEIADKEQIGDVVEIASMNGDMEVPIKLLRRFLDLPEGELAAAYAAEAVRTHFGSTLLFDEPRLFKLSLLSRRPLFGAELALDVNNSLLAARVLIEGEPSGVPRREARRYAQLLFEMLEPILAMNKISEAKTSGNVHYTVIEAMEDEARLFGFSAVSAVEHRTRGHVQ